MYSSHECVFAVNVYSASEYASIAQECTACYAAAVVIADRQGAEASHTLFSPEVTIHRNGTSYSNKALQNNRVIHTA